MWTVGLKIELWSIKFIESHSPFTFEMEEVIHQILLIEIINKIYIWNERSNPSNITDRDNK